jgi:hypothetical protein
MAKEKDGEAVFLTGAPAETLGFITALFLTHFPERDVTFLAEAFGQIQKAFAGSYPGYQACDTGFHNLSHTCQVATAAVCILDGYCKSGRLPILTFRDYELTVAGILLHDIGYLKEVGDNRGTGAKHTFSHVDRGVDFTARFLPPLGATPDEIRQVQLSIRSTAVNVDMSKLPFRDPRERFMGCVFGTADLLGQMAAPDYPERLPKLFREFSEAASYSTAAKGAMASSQSPEDLLRRTREFYNGYARRMLDHEWDGVYHLVEYHFPDRRNLYVEAIDANLDRIDRLLEN